VLGGGLGHESLSIFSHPVRKYKVFSSTSFHSDQWRACGFLLRLPKHIRKRPTRSRSFVCVLGGGLEPPTLCSSFVEWTISFPVLGIGRYLRNYCWDSFASLYTFLGTFVSSKAADDPIQSLARDCPALS
jgi:hypothetical protein